MLVPISLLNTIGQLLFSRFAADDDDIKGTISSVTRPSKKVFPRPKNVYIIVFHVVLNSNN